jgi:transposase InsO family protein
MQDGASSRRHVVFKNTHDHFVDLLSHDMSRKGNGWDNACVESFFGMLKRELVYHRHYATREEATQDIFEYIEVLYNRKCRQFHTGGSDDQRHTTI